ncbi:hypothetical protein THAOC_28902, partial [Thalassiosira oceanica]
RLSEGCIPDATPIKLGYGDDFYGYDALYSGWTKNGVPNGPGTLRFNGVVLKGLRSTALCLGGRNFPTPNSAAMSTSTCPNAPLVPVVSGGATDGYDDSDATSQRQQQLVPLVSGTQGDGGPGLNADAHSSSCGRADQVSADSAALGSTDLSLATATDSKSKKPGRKRKQKRGRKKKDAQTAAPGEAVVAPDSEARGPDGKSKPRRGRPRKSDQNHPVEEQASARVQRKLPNRNVKVEEEVTSIKVGAKDYSRSTGSREDKLSAYDCGLPPFV